MTMKARYYILFVCACWYSLPVFSQGLCSSSALVPVFKQDFGQGASNSSKTTVPAGFTTNYDFQSSDPLADGEYIVTPRVQNSQRNDWAQGFDHTGNANGNMFLVNAGTGAALFFTQQVDNLCPGSTYTFSAWLANVNTASHTQPICNAGLIYPNVTFRIKNTSGVILTGGTYSTGALPLTADRNVQPNWIQYGFTFTLPAGMTSLVLEMVDAYGGQPQCGNDLAIDDILFTACTPTASVAFSTASSVCTGTNSSVDVTLTNSPFTTPAYQWQKSTNGGSSWANIGSASTSATSYPLNNITLGDAALYRVLVGPDVASLSSNTCITASNSITLTVNPSPSVTVGSNSPVCSGNNINLTSTVTSGTATFTYSWSGPGGFSSAAANPVINNSSAAQSGNYTVLVTDSKTCTATGNTTITVNTTPTVSAITSGSNGGCVGGTIALSNTTPGGTWSSTNTSIATVDINGVVSFVSAGSVTITYTVSNGGCSASATKNLTVNSVSMQPDVIECNNGITHFNASDPDYGVTYSNSNGGNTYLWNITGGSFSYQGASSASSQYPNVQLQTGSSYTVNVQFTSGGITCSATQMVHKNVTASETINGPDDVTICFTAVSIPLSGTSSAVTNNHSWTTSGTGVFSAPSSLSTFYTPSAADKLAGTVTLTLSGSSSLNMNGNCGSATASDVMTLHILPENTGTNTTAQICSNQLFSHTANSSVGGSSFTWVSTVLSGSGSGNATNGSGNIANTLTNGSATTDFVVRYTVTPSSNGCTGTPYTVTVTVKPLPSLSINNLSPSICTGASANIQLSDVLAGSKYSWSSAVITGTASGNTNQASPTTTNTINDALVNSSSAAAVIRYTITAHSLSGCTSVNTTDVTVYPQPTTAQAGNDQSLCNTSAATLNGNTPASGTGTWTIVSGPNTPVFTNAASPSTTVTGLTTGTYILRWSISNGVCTASQDDVTILISPVTQAGSLSADATVCAPVNSGSLSITGYTGNIINWQSSIDNGANWTTLVNTTPNLNFSNLTTNTLFKASVQSGSCSILFSNTVAITVLQPPTISDAGPNQQRNGINSTTLAGNEPVNGTGAWTQVSGPNTAAFSNAASYNSSVTNLVVGTYLFRWTITNGICGNSFDDMQLIVDPPTVTGTLSSDATVCATGGNGATLTLSGYLGDILRWQSSIDNGNNWIDITNITSTYAYSNLTTTTLFRAEVQNGTDAPAFTSHVTITVLQPVTVADAGQNQTLCDLSSATLAGNNPGSGTGTWSVVSGPPSVTSFTNNNNYNSAINGLVAGTYQLKWTIANGGVCPSSEDLVTITVVPPTNPGNVTADATVCATSNGGTLSITGFTGDIVQGEYSVDNGLNWNLVPNSNNTTTIPYTNLPVTTQFKALVKNSVCPAVYSNIVTITVLQAVTTADAGANQQLCATSSATLAANNPTSGTGTWTQVSGPTTAGFVNAGAYNTNVTGLITGSYVFRWTITNGACASSQDDVTIVIDPATVPGTVSGTALVCYGNNSGTLNLNGYTGSIVRWEYSIDGGSGWINIANNTNSYTYSNLTATTLFRASVQSGVCMEQFTNNVLVTINPLTVAGTISSDATVCTGSNNGTLTLNGYTGSVLQWENSTDNGNNWAVIANTTNHLNYNNITATTIYRALVQNGICASQYSTQVTITVNPATVAGTLSSDATVCASSNNGTLSLASHTGNILRWERSADNGNSWVFIANTTNSFTYTNLTVSTMYRAVVQSGVCALQYSNNVTIIVNPVTIAGTLSSNATVCVAANNGTLTLSGFTGSIIQWESSADGNTWTPIANSTNAHSYTNLTTTTLFRVLVQNGICASQYSNNVTITVSPVTVAGILSANATVCTSANNGTLSLAGFTGSILQWESSADNGNSWTTIANTTNNLTYNNLTATTIYRVLVQSGGCALQYSNNATITVNPVTVAGTLSANATVCASSNNGMLSLSGYTGNIIQWESSTDGNTWTVIANTNAGFTYNNLTVTAIYRVLVQSGVCASQYSNNVTITVSPVTIAGTLSASATVCASSNNGTLSLSGYTGNIIQWERSTDGNTWTVMANTTASFIYNNLSVTTIYRTLVQSGVCASQYSNNVTVTVSPVTVAGILSANATVCASSNNGTLSVNGYTGSILQWEISTDNANTWATISNTTNSFTYNNLIATSAYRVLVQSGVCSPQYSNGVVITVAQPVTKANSGADQLLCNTNTVSLQANQPLSGTGNWSLLAGPSAVTITDPLSPNTGVSGITTGIYQFKWTISNNTCPVSADTVSVQVLPVLVNTIDTTTKAICTGQSVTINGTPAGGGDGTYLYQWEQSTNGILWFPVAGANSASYSFSPAADVYVRRIVTSHTCSVISNSTAILVQPSLASNTITGNQEICLGANIVPVRGSLATGGNGIYRYQWEQSTDSSNSSIGSNWSSINNATSKDLPDMTIRKTTAFRRIVTTNLCTGQQALTSNIVTVNIKPVPQLSLQYKGGAYCSKDTTIEFTTQTQNVDSVRWDFGDGKVEMTAAGKATHRYTQPGTFLPKLIASNAGNCTLSITPQDTIRIEDIKPGFTLSAVFDCGKTTYRFMDTSQSYFPLAKRTWLVNDAPMNNTMDYRHTFSNPGENKTRLQLQSIHGCEATLDARFHVGIYQYPKADINAVAQACMNNLVELKSAENSIDSVIIRSWNLGNGLLASDSVVKVSYSSSGEYTVKLTVATVNKCYDSAYKVLSIYPTPKLSVTTAQVVCKGDSAMVKVSGGMNYIWKDQDNNIICNNCPSIKTLPQKNTQYHVIGYSEYGCSEVAATSVRVIPPLRLNAKLLDTLCVGDSRKLLVSGADNYTWLPAPGLSSYTTAGPIASPLVTTTYTVVGKDAFNCFADTASIKLVVGDPTRVSVGKDTVVLAGNSVQLRAVGALPNIKKWRWDGGDFSCINCPTPTVRVVNDACVTCSVTNIFGCVSSDTLCIKTFCPTTEVFIPNAFTPDGDGINDKVYVQGKGIKLIKSFRIFSRWGEMVFEKSNFSPGDPSSGWDGKIKGKAATPDVFVYVCEVVCEKGTPNTYKGNVAIIK